MKSLISLSLCFLASLCSVFADKQFADHGFSFTYPEAMSVETVGKGIKTLIVKDESGTQITLQNYGNTITPEDLSTHMVKTLLTRFDKQSSVIEHKGITRTLLGAERKGTYLMLTPEDANIECVVFTFSVGNSTICVITQYATLFSATAENYFKTIQASLKLVE